MIARRLAVLAASFTLLGAAPAAASTLSGTVTSGVDGRGVDNFAVELYDAGFTKLQTTCTLNDGSYRFLNVAGGTYHVRFAGLPDCGTGGFAPQWYDLRWTQAAASGIDVVDGVDRTGVDAVMYRGAKVTGKVTDADTGAPIANLRVEVVSNGTVLNHACTLVDGTYTVADLQPLPASVRFLPDPATCGPVAAYPLRYYVDSSGQAAPVDLHLGQTTPDIDARLSLRLVRTLKVSPTGTGTVTSAPAGISCPGVCSFDFPWDSTVTLTATPGAGSVFSGWGAPCAGVGICVVHMTADTVISAAFTAVGGGGGGGGAGGGSGPAPQPATQPAAACRLAPKAKVKSGKVSVKITCDRTATLALSGRLSYKRGKRTQTLKLKRVTVTAMSRTVRFKLPSAARTALRKHRAVSAAFTLVATNAGGTAHVTAKVERLR